MALRSRRAIMKRTHPAQDLPDNDYRNRLHNLKQLSASPVKYPYSSGNTLAISERDTLFFWDRGACRKEFCVGHRAPSGTIACRDETSHLVVEIFADAIYGKATLPRGRHYPISSPLSTSLDF